MSKRTDIMLSKVLQSSNVKSYREKIRRLENELIHSLDKKELDLFLEYEKLVNEELYEIVSVIIQMKEVGSE